LIETDSDEARKAITVGVASVRVSPGWTAFS